MRKFLLSLFIILGVVFAIGVVNPDIIKNPRKLVYYSPCDSPLTYKIGTIDPKFGISEEELKARIIEAEKMWEDTDGRNLFSYDPQAILTVGMIYDERQALNQEIGELESKITQDKSVFDSKIQEFESRSAAFKQKIAEFNRTVDDWNQKGGAPKEEYDKLKSRQEELSKESDELSAMAKSLNVSASEFNSEVSKLNQTVDTFNSALQVKPEQGLYNGLTNTIDIYITSSNQELVHTLAHELGHALGMEHVADQNAIMYMSTSGNMALTASDLKELAYVCRERTVLEAARDSLLYLIMRYKATQQKSS